MNGLYSVSIQADVFGICLGRLGFGNLHREAFETAEEWVFYYWGPLQRVLPGSFAYPSADMIWPLFLNWFNNVSTSAYLRLFCWLWIHLIWTHSNSQIFLLKILKFMAPLQMSFELMPTPHLRFSLVTYFSMELPFSTCREFFFVLALTAPSPR